MTGKQMKWIVTAEHCCGASVDHPCIDGVYSDPVDDFSEIVIAADRETAEALGRNLLAEQIADAEPCKCSRKLEPGWDRWWDSIAFNATQMR